ncbi:MAG: alpha/beta hydrolase, partial [Actinomycetota bacterium]|nr:alpha/beta hydrolase [Actinomycetota bacterium]
MTTIVSRPGSSPAARRRLAGSGGWEEAWWFGPDGQRLFGFLHLPEGRPRAGIVVCSPLHAEFLRNYRREVLVARALAARGFAVQRFHYRGTGSSDGQASEATYETMRQDALLAAGHVLERSGATRLGFLGTRWGALVAAAGAAGFPGAPLA